MASSGPGKNSRDIFWAGTALFLIGVHSILLGLTIYFFTDIFYQTFFDTSVDNIFFVRQSGTFLFLAGLFYLYPLVSLRHNHHLVLLVIVSKIVAVVFLVTNAGFTPAPFMIYLAALFDGLMGLILIWVYSRCRQAYGRARQAEAEPAHAVVKENA